MTLRKAVGAVLGTTTCAVVVLAGGGGVSFASGSTALPRAEHTYLDIFPALDNDGHAHSYRKPSHFTFGFPDSTLTFTRLHWYGWGRARAVAHGRVRTCGEGTPCKSAAVKLVASRFGPCSDYNLYQSLTASGVPLFGTGPVSIAVAEQTCGVA